MFGALGKVFQVMAIETKEHEKEKAEEEEK